MNLFMVFEISTVKLSIGPVQVLSRSFQCVNDNFHELPLDAFQAESTSAVNLIFIETTDELKGESKASVYLGLSSPRICEICYISSNNGAPE